MLVFLVDKVNTHFFSRLVWEHLIQDFRVWVGKILEGILLRKKTFKFYINKKKYCLKKIQVWPIIDSIIAPLSKLQKVKCHGQTLIFLSWFRAHLCLFVFDPASPPPQPNIKGARDIKQPIHDTACHYHLPINSWNNKLHFNSAASNMTTSSPNALFMQPRCCFMQHNKIC